MRDISGGAIRGIIPTRQKQPVYNLHVPSVNNFIVETGAVVHNCYDIFAYSCRSRPFVMTKEDRYIEELGSDYDRAMNRIADPYATA